jgi:hypothetical protein
VTGATETVPSDLGVMPALVAVDGPAVHAISSVARAIAPPAGPLPAGPVEAVLTGVPQAAIFGTAEHGVIARRGDPTVRPPTVRVVTVTVRCGVAVVTGRSVGAMIVRVGMGTVRSGAMMIVRVVTVTVRCGVAVVTGRSVGAMIVRVGMGTVRSGAMMIVRVVTVTVRCGVAVVTGRSVGAMIVRVGMGTVRSGAMMTVHDGMGTARSAVVTTVRPVTALSASASGTATAQQEHASVRLLVTTGKTVTPTARDRSVRGTTTRRSRTRSMRATCTPRPVRNSRRSARTTRTGWHVTSSPRRSSSTLIRKRRTSTH